MIAATTHKLNLPSGHVALLDAADFERTCRVEFACGLIWEGRICDRPWRALVKQHTTYCVSMIHIGQAGLELRLHRAVLDAKAGQIVDHIDHNGLHCCRDNLRIVTAAENSQHRVKSKTRALPKGVALHKQTGRYEAYIRHHGRKIHLGMFDTQEAASAAYAAKAVELFGAFAVTS